MRHFRFIATTALALTVLTLGAVALNAAADDNKEDPDVIFVPTHQEIVEKMLEMAEVTKKDVVYDLGCGDGRIVLTAARKYGCKAKGFDIDPERIKECKANFDKEDKKVQDLVKFEQKNIFKQDLSDASVITLYLLPELNVRLVPQLMKLKAGSRIVSHQFDMRGYKPDKKILFKTKDGEREADIYLWTIPLKKEEVKDN